MSGKHDGCRRRRTLYVVPLLGLMLIDACNRNAMTNSRLQADIENKARLAIEGGGDGGKDAVLPVFSGLFMFYIFGWGLGGEVD